MDKAQEKILRETLWRAYCEGKANNKYVPEEVLPRLLKELGYRKLLDRPLLEEALRSKFTNLAVGMMIITGKLKVEDLGEEDKSRFEKICQLTFDQILSLIPELPKDKPPDIQTIVGKYYQECNASNPPKTYLAMEIAELIAQAYIKYYEGK